MDEEVENSGDESFGGSTRSSSSPIYSKKVWMLSVRPVRRLTRFSPLSLLFQPDIRLFCHHGSSCQMNEEHQAMYSHELPVFESIPTSDNPQGVPGILKTWSLESNCVFQDETSLPEELRNQHIIIYVHGHRTRYLKATAALSHLSLRAPDHTILGYLWPSHSRKESYILARSKASTEAANRLCILIGALQRMGNTIHIVAHSMGVRLALHALSPSQDNSPGSQMTNFISDSNQTILKPIQSLFMLGAAIPSNAFLSTFTDSDNSWNYQNLLVNQIINMYSAQDEVLSSAFKWAEALAQFSILSLFSNDTRAMGSVGIAIDSRIQADMNQILHDIDISLEVPTHSVHAYLASPTFQKYLRDQLTAVN